MSPRYPGYDTPPRQPTRARIRKVLAETYTPEGVELWMEREHVEWHMTVDEMFKARRGDEVLRKALSLRGQVAT